MYQYEEEQLSANIWYGFSIIGKKIVTWGGNRVLISLKLRLCEDRRLKCTQDFQCGVIRLQNCLVLKTADLATNSTNSFLMTGLSSYMQSQLLFKKHRGSRSFEYFPCIFCLHVRGPTCMILNHFKIEKLRFNTFFTYQQSISQWKADSLPLYQVSSIDVKICSYSQPRGKIYF